MAEYCDTPQSKERSNREYKVCLNESAILRLLDYPLYFGIAIYQSDSVGFADFAISAQQWLEGV